MKELFNEFMNFFNQLDFIDYHFNESENSIEININERYYIRRLRIIKRNEFIIIQEESSEEYKEEYNSDLDYIDLFLISDIILENLESDELILEFFIQYFHKLYDIDEFEF
jgi:hypothetical protein